LAQQRHCRKGEECWISVQRKEEKGVGCNNPKMKGWEDITRMFSHRSTDQGKKETKKKKPKKEKTNKTRTQETKKKLKAQKARGVVWSKRGGDSGGARSP
jgi:hypothetical protein